MNAFRTIRALLCLFLIGTLPLSVQLQAQEAAPAPHYVPPDIVSAGIDAHYQHLAVVESDCRTDVEARALADALTERGALVSIVSSPGRILAWVPPEAQEDVLATRLSAAGRDFGVQAVAYSVEDLDNRQLLAKRELTEADKAVRDFLEWAHQPMTEERRRAREEAELRYEMLRDVLPNDGPVVEVHAPETEGPGGSEDEILGHATKAYGHVHHTTFFVESKSGTGSWDWPVSVYNDYRTLASQAMTWWTSEASKYGRTMIHHWHIYSPWNSVCQVNGEPTVVGEGAFIPVVLDRAFNEPFPLSWGIGDKVDWARGYNKHMRNNHGADESIIGFIAYKATAGEGIWPHAISWISGGDREGVYYALDNQYWQAVPDPLANPYRNVIAHEIGHLFGCPDEYYSSQSSCDWSYRGQKNWNCQRFQSAPGHPGTRMHGFDGMMKGNYTGGTSLATPVHTGMISASQAVPLRRFRTSPHTFPVHLHNCDAGTWEFNETIYVPVAHDYCMRATVYLTRSHGGTTYYFTHWELKYDDGHSVDLHHYGTSLPSSALYSSRSNPIVDVVAHYTANPPDYQTSNTTLTAWLSEFNHTMSPEPCVGLRWRSNYDMTHTQTKIQYQRGSSWVDLTPSHIVLNHPTVVNRNQWTGVRIHSVPGVGGDQDIQPNREYRFRIRGVYNTLVGDPSVVATVRTRPASPADTVYCYDANEVNTPSSPKTLPSMGPGIDPYTVHGAVTIAGASGEFSWRRPKADHYRITVIGLSSSLFGTKVRMLLKVKDGSHFDPEMTWRRAGATAEHSANYNTTMGGWVMYLPEDGEYIIKVDADIHNISGMYDLVDRHSGHFGYGEYSIGISRQQLYPSLVGLCAPCVRVTVPRPYPGLVIMEPFPPPELVIPTRPGFDPKKGANFNLLYIPPPDQKFVRFVGQTFSGAQNPLPIGITPNTPPGEHVVIPETNELPNGEVGLVVVNPDCWNPPLYVHTTHAVGDRTTVEAKPAEFYEFIRWVGDTSTATNPLEVVMWKHKRLIAVYRPKPCEPEPMPQWSHIISVTNARQGSVRLEYGMQGGAGDGLEAGQTDLPPIPPPGTFDVRWINIAGSQGSPTDIRDIKKQHTYQGSVQTGAGTTPVRLQWSTPPLSSSFTMRLRIPALSVDLDMHTTSSYELVDEGKYIFYVDVKEPECPPPTEEPDIDITTERVDPDEFPCVNLELLIKHKQTGAALPYYNPYRLKIYEKDKQGAFVPTRISRITQRDSTLVLRICPDDENDDPDREIIVIPDEDDPDKIPDTTTIDIPDYIPDPNEDMFRFTRRNSGDWEMVSLPVKMVSSLMSSLYPDAGARLYRFNTASGAYEGVTEMDFGVGYWLKTATPSTLFVGNEVTNNTLNNLSGLGEPYGYGWNMIGSISHPVAVSAIGQNPAGCMHSIFGWDPASGYIVPSSVDPGEGYWVRLEPNASLSFAGSSARVGGTTAYEKAMAGVTTAATLSVMHGSRGGQILRLASRPLESGETDILSLPQPPPGGLFDVRSGDGTLFFSPGDNTLRIQHDGSVRLALKPRSDLLRSVQLLDESGALLYEFRTGQASVFEVDVSGTRSFLLRYEVAEQSTPRFALEQNYPNPVRSGEQTVLHYSIDREGPVLLQVFDLLGRRVGSIVDGTRRPGSYTATWRTTGERGAALPSGLYMIRLEAGGKIQTRRCTIVR